MNGSHRGEYNNGYSVSNDRFNHHDRENGHRRGAQRLSSRSRSRSRSPYGYAHYHENSPSRPQGKHSPRSSRDVPDYLNGHGGRRKQSERPGSIENIRRHTYRDDDYGGRSSPTYLPYSVPECERASNRDRGREIDYDSDDKGLENLSPHDYRMVKREKLRKKMVACIWRVTPSPPRDMNGHSGGSHEKKNLDERDAMVSADYKIDTFGLTSVVTGRKEPIENQMQNMEDKITAAKDVSPGNSSSNESSDASSSEDDRHRKKKTKQKRNSSPRLHNQKRYAVKASSSGSGTESSETESSGSLSDDRRSRKRNSKRKDNVKKSMTKQKASNSRSKRKGKSHKRHHVSSSDGSSGDEEEEINGQEKAKKSPPRHEKVSSSQSSEEDSKGSPSTHSEGETEKDEDSAFEIDEEALKFKVLLEAQKKSAATLDNEPMVGPAPAPKAEGHISYGGALRPGEGDAIAQYVQQGKRIPRRGEVGLSAEEIQKYESLGYVMSGSRHQRMNAIRIRKENQVYSAEDKRALAMFNYEEKAKREHQVMSDLQRLIQRHIGEDPGPTHDPFAAKQSDQATDA
ncbi:hypothetical protein KP509_24G045500 [Ceratopteris richardii]|nr:hypothetical protein KP509_24G045500 [Ceratopteris richardii]